MTTRNLPVQASHTRPRNLGAGLRIGTQVRRQGDGRAHITLVPKCKDLHGIATLIQSEPSGNIHAGGEPTCPAAGQAQTRVTL